MTDVYGGPGKAFRRRFLFEAALQALRDQGWKLEKVPGIGKSSVRRISKPGRSLFVSIRTSQDTWVAFPLRADGTFGTLEQSDAVVVSTLDDRENPKFANVHFIEGDEMRDRFGRALAARRAAGHSLPVGRGLWVSMYHRDADDPVYHVGGGAGLDHLAIAHLPLPSGPPTAGDPKATVQTASEPLTIAEAKLRLAESLGVEPSNIKISVEA